MQDGRRCARTRCRRGSRDEDLQVSITSTYHRLRVILVIVAFGLPLYLGLVGRLIWDVPLQHSLSAYHGSEQDELRDGFVGFLLAGAVCLIIYRGITGLENWALNVAGMALIVVAMIPAETNEVIHYGAAITFFLFSAYVSFFRSWDTLTEDLIRDEKTRRFYTVTYRVLSLSMVVIVGLTLVLANRFDPDRWVFFLEMVAVWSFGLYWAVKSFEVSRSDVDWQAIKGQVSVGEAGWRKTFDQIPVTRTSEVGERVGVTD